MKKIVSYIMTFITIVAGIATIGGLYFQLYEKKPIIEIKTISKDSLTKLPSIEGLNATYKYKNEKVVSLWKLHYIISNIGNEIIIGEGSKKNIIKDNISLEINDSFKILEIEDKNTPFKLSIQENKILISFLQWKPQENIELVIYAEQIKKDSSPQLTTNDREIINSNVIYNTLEIKDISKGTAIFYKLPSPLQSTIKWFSIFIYGIFLIVMPILWFSELIKKIKYNTWLKSNTQYKAWVNQLIEEKRLSAYTEPNNLPTKLWKEYPYTKPKLPDNDFKSLTWGVIIFAIFCIIPLLFFINY